MIRLLRDERGSMTLELAILTPALLVLLGLVVLAGRIETSAAAVDQAARSAARAASLTRTADAARTAAQSAATRELSGTDCVSIRISADVSGFSARLGDDGTVAVTVTCTVSVADLSIPGLPGFHSMSANAVSPIDRYRSR